MLFEAILSRGQRQEFILNEPLNIWFEGSSYSSAYFTASINITHGTEGTFGKNNGKFDLTSKGLWFHGTTHKGAKNIRKNGISLIYIHTKTDFGSGFYLLPSLFNAKEWECRKSSNCGRGAMMIHELHLP